MATTTVPIAPYNHVIIDPHHPGDPEMVVDFVAGRYIDIDKQCRLVS